MYSQSFHSNLLWTVSLLHLTGAIVSHILSSLEDVNFERIQEDQFQSSRNGGVAYPNATLARELFGSGYHRDLTTRVQVEGVAPDSRILLVENITRDIYMDIDQVDVSDLSALNIWRLKYFMPNLTTHIN